MADAVDVYSDQFQITLGPYGCTLSFLLSSPLPPAPGTAVQPERQASVRMSLEHLKVMTFLMRRQLADYERNTGVEVSLPMEVLNSLRIGPEDWESFWRR